MPIWLFIVVAMFFALGALTGAAADKPFEILLVWIVLAVVNLGTAIALALSESDE